MLIEMAAAEEYGPGLPPDLPTGVVESDCFDKASGPTDTLPSYGPCLPPELVGRETNESSRTFGPVLPPPGVCTLADRQEEGGEGNRASQIPTGEEGEEKEAELIGPSLPGASQQVRDLSTRP